MSRFFSTASAPGYLQNELLYERKPVTDLWKKLTAVAKAQWKWRATTNVFMSSKKRVLQVRGPPGTGTSSATFSWVYNVCTMRDGVANVNLNALWINCDRTRQESKCWSIARDEQGTAVQVSEMPTVPRNAADTAASYHIVVFDGVRKATLEDWRGFLSGLARHGVFVVFVSSEGVRMHQGDSDDLLHLDHFVSSWTMDEYVAACSSDQFWSNCCEFFETASDTDSYERRKELLEEKFYVSGQSARYMFGLESDDVRNRIATNARFMGGISALEDAARSDRSSGAVNSLIARTREGSNGVTPRDHALLPTLAELVPPGATRRDELRPLPEERDPLEPEKVARLVSSFASEKVVKQLPSSIARLRSVAKALQNKVIEGYALEEQVKKSLNEARNPGVGLTILINGQMATLPVANFLECTKDELESMLAESHPRDTWIFVGGQQGAFDAVHVVSRDYIRFVQTTAGATHKFYLDIIDTMLAKLATNHQIHWQHIEVMVMRPSDDHRKFALQAARGSLAGFTRFDEKPWDRSNGERDNVVYSRLYWSD